MYLFVDIFIVSVSDCTCIEGIDHVSISILYIACRKLEISFDWQLDNCLLLSTNDRCVCLVQEHQAEIDARSGTFQNFEDFGKELLKTGHYAEDEIKEKLQSIANSKEQLNEYFYSFCDSLCTFLSQRMAQSQKAT